MGLVALKDNQLLETYRSACELNLAPEFLDMLMDEIISRGLLAKLEDIYELKNGIPEYK